MSKLNDFYFGWYKMNEKIYKLRNWIKESKKIVFFGGAGVSCESGIPDFRSEDGIYSKKYEYPPEYILSCEFFYNHTDKFYEFYKKTILIENVKPNGAHKILAYLENEGKLSSVVTQNIDGLHSEAGSKNVYELHGTIYKNTCVKCGKKYGIEYIKKSSKIPLCTKCGSIIKPDVVLYDESLDDSVVEGAIREIKNADMLIVGGTSLTVYPAAGFIRYFMGDKMVIINKSATPYDSMAGILINEAIGETLTQCL